MAITHSFIVRYDQLEEGDDLTAVRGDLVPDCVMLGDFELTIDSVEFGEPNVELLGLAIGMFQAVTHVLAFGGDKSYSFAECDLKLEITDSKDEQLVVAYVTSAGYWKKAYVDGLQMMRAAARLLREVLAETFDRHPQLLLNHSFLRSCPFAMHYARDARKGEFQTQDMCFYSSPDALREDMSGRVEVRRPSKA